ncbi:MAG: toxin-antitoxin system YwqK family antitoxin [Bacteroidota bacterium]
MKKYIFLFASLFYCGFVLASVPADTINKYDSKGKKQGKWIKKNSAGKIIYEGTFKENIPTGKFIYYSETGEVNVISIFSDDGKTVMSNFFFQGNILESEGKYVNQKRDGVWKFYLGKDILGSEENYKNGKKDGLEKNYFPNGKLSEEKTWKDSIQHGQWKQYYDDGTIKSFGTYNNGFLEGEVKYYFPGNIISVEGHFQHSVKHGKWTYYNRDGNIIINIENYNTGLLEGEFAEWYEKDGKPKSKGQFKKGREDGKWITWFANRNVQIEIEYKLGDYHGSFVEYYENGKKKTEGNYFFGNKTGKWIEWNEDGMIVKEETCDSIDMIKKKTAEKKK